MVIPSERELPSDLFPVPSAHDPIIKDPIFAKQYLDGPANILPQPDTLLEIARRKLMLSFVEQLPLARAAWEAGGLTQDERSHNIIEHQVVSAILGEILGKEAGLPEKAIFQTKYALSVHDATKILERDTLERAAQKPKSSLRRRTVEKALTIHHSLIQRVGIDDTINALSEANIPDRIDRPSDDLREQIIHFIDAIMDGSQPKSPAERMHQATTTSGSRRTTHAIVDAHHAEVLGLPVDKSYRQLQVELALKEAALLCEMIRAQGVHTEVTPESLPKFLQQRFDETVRAFAKKNGLAA